jgi:hypothetical protein
MNLRIEDLQARALVREALQYLSELCQQVSCLQPPNFGFVASGCLISRFLHKKIHFSQ